MLSFSFRAIAGSLICFTSLALAAQPSSCPNEHKHMRASLRHIEGGGIGYNQGYTTFETFLATDPNKYVVMPFLDARGHVFDNGKWAANAGVGIRGILGCRAYGFNAYYDYRNTKKLHYNQVGIGFETLGTFWDIRLNGYLPVGKKITPPSHTQFDRFSGHHMIVSSKYQFAMKGADAEIGFHFGKSRHFDFYAAAGPYYYIGEVGGNAWGGKARLSGMFKEYITLEISNSYDSQFHNNFQGQLTVSYPFGGKSRVKKKGCQSSCKRARVIGSRMVQPVGRQEIIVVGSHKKHSTAIDLATGQPLYFVFVDNTSHSSGTFESPYPTLALAQAHSKPGDTIYVFPGDGTTTGMNSGIFLQPSQNFWGSGVSHLVQTSLGAVSLPAQSSTTPLITNTNVDTEGNIITLASNNSISGFTMTSALNDAIFGTDAHNLDVSFCTFENTSTFPIEASFSGDTAISVTNNQFLSNVNGVSLTLNGTSTVVCSDNTFKDQTSVSNVPIEITANNNVLSILIANNVFSNNTTGSVRFGFDSVSDAHIALLNNTMINNGTGAQSNLASSVTFISTGTIDQCAIALENNMFSGNASNSLYLHTSGVFTTLSVTASTNTISNNGGSALVVATPVDALTVFATNNTISDCDDNGIAVISAMLTSAGNIMLNNNSITNIANASNGIAINQDFSTLNLTILNNSINGCEGTGIISYAPNGIDSLALNISGNTISNCQNLSSNAAAGLDIEQFTTLSGTILNNILSNNTTSSNVFIVSTETSPSVCLEVSGNSSDTGYTFSNGSGVFNVTPCDVNMVNTGTITGTFTPVQSCPGAAPCPP